MVNVVLTHSALGLEGNVESWAEWLRGEGHEVVTPDLFGGDTYDDFDEGVARADSRLLSDHASLVRMEVRALEGPVVLMGFSLGAAVSELAAFTEPGVDGAVLMFGAMAPRWMGNPPWPSRLRMQVHVSAEDPWSDPAQVDELEEHAPEGALQVFRYPGSAHLFTFPNHPDYSPLSADRARGEIKAFLASFRA